MSADQTREKLKKEIREMRDREALMNREERRSYERRKRIWLKKNPRAYPKVDD